MKIPDKSAVVVVPPETNVEILRLRLALEGIFPEIKVSPACPEGKMYLIDTSAAEDFVATKRFTL